MNKIPMCIKLIFSVLFFCIHLVGMETEVKKSLIEIPQDCLRIIYKNPSFDLQSVCLLSKTCKHFQVYFNNLITQKDTASDEDKKWMNFLIRNNSTQCTKMLISYSHCYKEAKKLLKSHERDAIDYFYEEWSEEKKKKLFFCIQQKEHYRDIFNCLYQYSLYQRDLSISAIIGKESLNPLVLKRRKAYRGEFLTQNLTTTAFFHFLKQKEYELMLQLVRNNIELFKNYYDAKNYHILHYIYLEGDLDLVKKVVACGIDITTPTRKKGETLICCAYERADLAMVKLLLKCGLKYEQGRSDPLYNGIMYPWEGTLKEISELLISHDYYPQEHKNKLLESAIEHGHQSVALFLIKHGADIKKISLRVLCRGGYLEEVKSLFAENSMLASQYSDSEHYLIVFSSMRCGNLELLDFICKQGFKLDIPNITGGDHETILLRAIKNSQWEVAKILLKHGANIDDDWVLYSYLAKKYREGTEYKLSLFDINEAIREFTGDACYQKILDSLMRYKTKKESLEIKSKNNIENHTSARPSKINSFYSFFKSFYHFISTIGSEVTVGVLSGGMFAILTFLALKACKLLPSSIEIIY